MHHCDRSTGSRHDWSFVECGNGGIFDAILYFRDTSSSDRTSIAAQYTALAPQ